jgi:hypothetical protein
MIIIFYQLKYIFIKITMLFLFSTGLLGSGEEWVKGPNMIEQIYLGIMTESIIWMTPLLHSISVVTTFASSTCYKIQYMTILIIINIEMMLKLSR